MMRLPGPVALPPTEITLGRSRGQRLLGRAGPRRDCCQRCMRNQNCTMIIGLILLSSGIAISAMTFHEIWSENVFRIVLVGPVFITVGAILVAKALIQRLRNEDTHHRDSLTTDQPGPTDEDVNRLSVTTLGIVHNQSLPPPYEVAITDESLPSLPSPVPPSMLADDNNASDEHDADVVFTLESSTNGTGSSSSGSDGQVVKISIPSGTSSTTDEENPLREVVEVEPDTPPPTYDEYVSSSEVIFENETAAASESCSRPNRADNKPVPVPQIHAPTALAPPIPTHSQVTHPHTVTKTTAESAISIDVDNSEPSPASSPSSCPSESISALPRVPNVRQHHSKSRGSRRRSPQDSGRPRSPTNEDSNLLTRSPPSRSHSIHRSPVRPRSSLTGSDSASGRSRSERRASSHVRFSVN